MTTHETSHKTPTAHDIIFDTVNCKRFEHFLIAQYTSFHLIFYQSAYYFRNRNNADADQNVLKIFASALTKERIEDILNQTLKLHGTNVEKIMENKQLLERTFLLFNPNDYNLSIATIIYKLYLEQPACPFGINAQLDAINEVKKHIDNNTITSDIFYPIEKQIIKDLNYQVPQFLLSDYNKTK